MTRFPHVPVVLLAGALLLVGCRTYGDAGYQSEQKTYDAIQQTVQQIEQDLGRAQSDLRRLESAAETMDTLRVLTERYRTLVDSHESALAQHREQAEHLTGESAYRTLHRVYGAMVTDRRLLQRQYERTTRKVWATVRTTAIPRVPFRPASSYMITPVRFPRVDGVDTITMAEALQGVEGTPGLQMEEQTGDTE
jgi:hypothetical protein